MCTVGWGSPGRAMTGRAMAHHMIPSHRLIAHSAADGGRWTGLRGFCDHSCVPLLLSSVMADGLSMGRLTWWCADVLTASQACLRCDSHPKPLWRAETFSNPAWHHSWVQDGTHLCGILKHGSSLCVLHAFWISCISVNLRLMSNVIPQAIDSVSQPLFMLDVERPQTLWVRFHRHWTWNVCLFL